MMTNKNRICRLTVGDYNNNQALVIDGLSITFRISKSSDNKDSNNSAVFEVINLSEKDENTIGTDFVYVKFEVGYEGNYKTLYEGQAVQVVTRDEGTDTVTQIICGTGFVELNHNVMSKVIPENTTVKEAFELITKELPNISKGVYKGVNVNSNIVKGYSANGTVKEILDKLASAYNVEWRVNDNVFYVTDKDEPDTTIDQAYVINRNSGLVGSPYRTSGDGRKTVKDETKTKGVIFTSLINPDYTVGNAVKIEDKRINGWFKVLDIDYTGGNRTQDFTQTVNCVYLEKVIDGETS